MPRQSTVLASKDDRRPKPKSHGNRKKAGRALNAFAIAEKQHSSKSGIARHRLGATEDDDDGSKRKRGSAHARKEPDHPSKRRRTDEEGSDLSEDGGSDSEGNEWRMGQVDSDDDSDIDSDEAMDSQDERDFEGFTFGNSSTNKKSKVQKRSQKEDMDLSEGDEDMENEDDLGEHAVDLAAAWDMNAEISEEERNPKSAKDKKKAKMSKSKQEDEEDEEGSSEGSDFDDEEESSDESAFSVSEDENDTRGLSKLQKFVKAMEAEQALSSSKTASRRLVSLQGSQPTEFGVAPSRKLTVADLMPTISDSKMRGSLKHIDDIESSKKSKSGTVGGKLEVPLAKRQQDRLDRTAAYEKSKETLNRWIDTVKANRRAEHLSFPLPEPGALEDRKIGDIKHRTDLESTIQNILMESGLADSNEKSAEDRIQEFEELQAKKIPLEEIQARRAELRQARELLFREEVRSKRIKKIKSKAYRRVHRKERERAEMKEREAMAAAGIDMDDEERERLDRARAESRMGAKHRESKWAKSLKQTGRQAWDDEARDGMAELARRGEELQRRIEGRRVVGEHEEYLDASSSESDEEDDGFGSSVKTDKINNKLNKLSASRDSEGDEIEGSHARLFNMKFMRNAEASRKAENDAEVRRLQRELAGEESQSEDEEEETGRQRFGRKDTKTSKPATKVARQDFEEPESDEDQGPRLAESDGEVDIQVKPKPSAKTTSSSNAFGSRASQPTVDTPVEETDVNPWLMQSTKKSRKQKGHAIDATESTLIDNVGVAGQAQKPAAQPKRKSSAKNQSVQKRTTNHADESSEDEESRMPVLLKNEDLVKKAFAGDEVVADFTQEKLDVMEDEGDKVVETTLPGWGSWAGSGLTKREKKQAKTKRTFETVDGIKPEKRKDAKLDRVIINEKRVRKNVKYLASQLPHPYESKEQYERSLRLPIGPEWTTKDTFQQATKPRVMVKQGVIKPMQKSLM
ncbi:hypothetical protein AJ80_03793 [Polytolypa hystricis UAMH7299]|uniref:Uncharacterized protein n=1 Tax=Polytolypa hystricis (strain UAMH7299) TaxID=1447883 RepID=A0A2B7Y6Y9_POLH7|nr:hypothetical protein AJ80_03793 [Polytolypa hystricis UAMH7299]